MPLSSLPSSSEKEEEAYNDDDDDDEQYLFPTLPGFTIPVEIRRAPQYGDDQFGIFVLQDIPPHTEFWVWTDRVQKIYHNEIRTYIAENYKPHDLQGIRRFLRRGFVLPAPYDDHWNSNPTDAGSIMNHSSTPNCGQPYGTLRWIRKGEELTMDYSGNGNPKWYVDICHSYGILTGVEIAQEEQKRGGVVQPAIFVAACDCTETTSEHNNVEQP